MDKKLEELTAKALELTEKPLPVKAADIFGNLEFRKEVIKRLKDSGHLTQE